MLKRLDIDKNRHMDFDEFLRAVSGNLPEQSEIQKKIDFEPEINYLVPRFYSKPEYDPANMSATRGNTPENLLVSADHHQYKLRFFYTFRLQEKEGPLLTSSQLGHTMYHRSSLILRLQVTLSELPYRPR